MSRGSVFAMGAKTRRSLALLWVALLITTLALPITALTAPSPVRATSPESCGIAPIDVEIILDQSTSMGGSSSGNPPQTRQAWAKQAAVQIITSLQNNGGVGTGAATSTGGRHRVGLTTFSGSANPGYNVRASLGSQNATAITNTINGLSASGNTPLKAGMAGGAADLTSHQRTTDFGLTVNHVIILISDGRPNPDGPSSGWGNGTSQRPTAADAMAFKGAADEVFSVAIGQGGSGATQVDTALMQALAKPNDATHYANVVNGSDLPALFANIFQSIACKTTPTIATTASAATVDFGGSVHDNLTITGDGTHAVTGSVAFWLCGPTAADANCTAGASLGSVTLANGSADSPNVTIGQAAADAGHYCFRAAYTPDEAASSYYNAASHANSTTECFTVLPATISLAKTADANGSAVNPGTSLGYVLTISNTGGSTAFGVSVTDNLPTGSGLDWQLASADPGWTLNGTTLSFSGSLAAGASKSAHVTSPTTQATCGPVINSATASSSNDGSDSVGPVVINVTCATLAWQKHDEDGKALGGATFTVTPNPFTGTGSLDVTDNQAPDQAPAAGAFKLVDLLPGTYTVTEKAPPAGYLLDDSSKQITLAGGQDGVISNAWVDAAYTNPTLSTTLVGDTSGKTPSTLTFNLDNTGTSSSFSDQAALGATDSRHLPTGSVTYTVYSDAACQSAVDTSTVQISENGAIPASKTFSVDGTGTWRVVASYAGDKFNAGASSACNDEVVTVVAPSISVHKGVDLAAAKPGDTLHYTITVENTGTGASSGVSLNDDISALLAHGTAPTDLQASGGVAGLSGSVISWTGDIAAGATVTLSFSVALDAVFPAGTTSLGNTVVVDGRASNCPKDSVDSSCSTSTEVTAAPILTLAKQVRVGDSGYSSGGPAQPGDVLTYRLTIANTGNADATGQSVSDDLSAVLAHASWNGNASPSSGSADFTSPNLSWYGITIPAGGTATLTFSFTLATSGWTAGTTDLPNTAVMAGSENCSPLPEVRAATVAAPAGCSTDTTVTTGTDLRITKSVAPGSIPGGASTPVAYTLVVSNVGNGDTTGNVVVTDDDFPTFYAISGVVCSPDPANDTCDAAHLQGTGIDLGKLSAGASVTITVSGTAAPDNDVVEGDVGAHVNTAQACETFLEGQPLCVHDQATLEVTFTHHPGIAIAKTPSVTVLPPGGGAVTYTYAVTNTGNVPLSSVSVVDDKCSPVGYTGGDGNDNGLLDLRETWTFTCAATLKATTTNVATVTGHDGEGSVEATDEATVTVTQAEPTPTPKPKPTATPKLTLPPTSTVDGPASSGPSGNGLLLILVVVAGLMLAAGAIAPTPARARRRARQG